MFPGKTFDFQQKKLLVFNVLLPALPFIFWGGLFVFYRILGFWEIEIKRKYIKYFLSAGYLIGLILILDRYLDTAGILPYYYHFCFITPQSPLEMKSLISFTLRLSQIFFLISLIHSLLLWFLIPLFSKSDKSA
jgi:hypothetical protein